MEEPAPRARRIGARVVDLVVMAWLVAFFVVEVEGRFLDGDPLATRAAQPVSSAQVMVALLVVVAVLDVAPTALWGRTPGKSLLGLRVLVAVPPGAAVPARVGPVRAVLRAGVLFAPLAVPYLGVALVAGVGLSGVLLPGGRGLHDLVAGTAVSDAPVGPRPGGRHRYPRRSIDPLPLPDVARTALVEVGVPRQVRGAFDVDVRMAVFDDVLFSVGEDPHGRALCIVSPTGEVLAVDPDGVLPPLLAGTSLPRFLDALDVLAARSDGDAAPDDADALRGRLEAADPDAVADPDSWWPTVWP